MTRPMTAEEEHFEYELDVIANMSEEEIARDRLFKLARIADLEKQIAEERRQHATTKARLDGTSEAIPAIVAPYLARAEAAEKRVAELQTLVNAATCFFFGAFTAREDLYKEGWVIDSNCGRRAPKGRMLKVKAIALARELAAKESK